MMKIKAKLGWSTISPISTKQTTTSRLKSLNIQVLTLLEQAHKLGGIKPVKENLA